MNKLEEKLLIKIKALGFKEPPLPASRSNPFTGIKHVLEPLACLLFDFITTRTFVCDMDYTRGEWDRARRLFCEKWPTQYYDLLD